MNTKILKNLLILVLGAAVGSLITAKVLKTKYEELAQEEIDQIKEYWENKYSEDTEIDPDEYQTLVKETADKINEELDSVINANYVRKAGRYGSLPEKKDLNTVLREKGLTPLPDESKLTPTYSMEPEYPEDDPAEEDDEEYEDAKIQDLGIGKPDIEIISSMQFDEQMYEKTTLFYYAGDQILTDERDEPVPDFTEIIGEDAVNNFGHLSDDPSLVFVRNHRMSTDFEIVLNPSTFVESVYGIKMEESTPKVEPKSKATTTTRKKRVDTDGAI